MRITARVYCQRVEQHGTPENDRIGALPGTASVSCENVVLVPIYSSSDDDPNRSYAEATPSGKVELTITNKAAIGAFTPGEIYDVVFTPAMPREPVPFSHPLERANAQLLDEVRASLDGG